LLITEARPLSSPLCNGALFACDSCVASNCCGGSRTYHVFSVRIDHDTVIHSTGVTGMVVGDMKYVFQVFVSNVGVGGCVGEKMETAKTEEGSEDSAFGVLNGNAPQARMIVSLSLTSPEPITLPISTLFWTSLLSLLIAVLISFSKNFAMVRAFPFRRGFYSRSSPPSSGSLGSPERIATSESSSGSPELRMHLCSAPSLVLVSKSPMCLVHGREGGILISISASISPCNHT
jgi:hypothetical protein